MLVTTHGLTLLTRMHRRFTANALNGLIANDRTADERLVSEVIDATTTLAAQRKPDAVDSVESGAGSGDVLSVNIPADSRWHTMAPRLLEQLSLKNAGRADVVQVLYLSYDRALADRDIGRRLGLDHHTVGKIVRAADAHVLHEHQGRVITAL